MPASSHPIWWEDYLRANHEKEEKHEKSTCSEVLYTFLILNFSTEKANASERITNIFLKSDHAAFSTRPEKPRCPSVWQFVATPYKTDIS